MKHIILIGIVLCGSAWAEWDYGTALTNMAYALEQPRATLDVSFTNRLSTWIGEATNASHVANIDFAYYGVRPHSNPLTQTTTSTPIPTVTV